MLSAGSLIGKAEASAIKISPSVDDRYPIRQHAVVNKGHALNPGPVPWLIVLKNLHFEITIRECNMGVNFRHWRGQICAF